MKKVKTVKNNNILSFQKIVLDWYKAHGRKDLPWQLNTTPYTVWISEIMLQQTQVSTVIGYYQKFIKRFPTLFSLALAQEDEVLHLWTGLGYYARARNIHKAAKIIMSKKSENLSGKFPDNLTDLQTLPGIGRSTAGAILSFGFNQRGVILDGNVRRVLSRYHAIESYNNGDKLWEIAELLTPPKASKNYTQAMMDLGSMICTRTKPKCGECPLKNSCLSNLRGEQLLYPGKKPSKTLPIKKVIFLILKDSQGKVLLEKRASGGIWGGLWSLPELANKQEIRKNLTEKPKKTQIFREIRHTFSHFYLDILPIEVKIRDKKSYLGEGKWYDLEKPHKIGLAAPVKKILLEDLTIRS